MLRSRSKPKPKSRAEENNPFINTFNALKGIYYPERTRKLIRRTNQKESKIKKLRESVLERKKEPKEYSHPYEKKIRKSRKKYVAPPSAIITRSMRRSQEIPFIKETIKDRPKPSKKKPSRKMPDVSL